jgi:plastocyanin
MIKRITCALVVLVCVLALAAQRRTVAMAAAASAIANAVPATVSISNFKFEPQNITVRRGAVVKWMDKEGSHTVTANDGSFDSGGLTAGKSFSHKFPKAGTFKYHCSIHGEEMSGTVTVK